MDARCSRLHLPRAGRTIRARPDRLPGNAERVAARDLRDGTQQFVLGILGSALHGVGRRAGGVALLDACRGEIANGRVTMARKNRKPVAKITPQTADRTSDPKSRSAFAALRKSLRAKRATGYRVGTISEDDKYGDDHT